MSDLGNKKIFAQNLKYYMDLYNKSRADVAKAIGVSYTTFTSWITAANYPRIDKIEMLANYFRVNKADLIENKYNDGGYYTDPTVNEYAEHIRTNPNMRLLFDATKDMTKEDIDYVVDLVNRLKNK